MSKRAQIIIFLIVISVGVIIYLLLTSKIITIKPQGSQSGLKSGKIATKIDEVQMENDYKTGIKAIINDYEILLVEIDKAPVEIASSTAAGISEVEAQARIETLKTRLAELKAPEKINKDAKRITMEYLLPSFNMMESYFARHEEKDKKEAIALAEKIKQDFPLLIN